MSNEKSVPTGKHGSTANAPAVSVTPKLPMNRRRINVKMVQSVLLIWLDANIDEENNADCQNTITQLQCVVNSVNTFTNGDQCVEFLETIDDHNKACMIISDLFCQHILPRVHKLSQVDSIFIFCSNKQYHQQWAKDWAKIKGVFTEIAPICEALKAAAQECEYNAIPMSFLATDGGDGVQRKLDQLHCSFMYTQIFRNILLTITFEPKHLQEFIEHCYEQFADVPTRLPIVEELKENYDKKTPVWWYSRDSFLYPMLNTALRLMDVDVMIKMGFFISDLHRQIDQLYKEQFPDRRLSTTFPIYRGQGMSEKDFQEMYKTKGGLMAFNSFLSTSKIRDVSLQFADSVLSNPDLVGILFVMTIDPSRSSTPFASINDVSYFQDDEDEVLFSMHAVFRIRDIKSMSGNDRLYEVNLELTSDNDKDLQVLTDRLGEELEESIGWDRLGYLLLKMQQSKKAEQVYEFLLEQPSNEADRAIFYYQLGWAKDDQGEYKEALALSQKSLAIRQKLLPPTHPDLAKSYNSIGLVYDNMGDYLEALSSHEKALTIRQQSLPPTHPDLAKSYNNIGLAYYNMGDYSKALSYYEKTLEIHEETLPPTHPDLAMSYNNIGSVYSDMGDYSKALSSREKALAIWQQSLPSTHPHLAYSYNNIGLVYYNMSDYSKALSYYEKVLAIWQQSLPPTHPHMASSYSNIGLVYKNMGDYSKALSYYEKALAIREQSLPSTHPDLAMSYDYIGSVYSNMGDYSKALSSHEKAFAIKQQSLPSTHPDLAYSYNNIGCVYEHMRNYSKAHSFCKRAVEIAQQSLLPDHPELQKWKRDLDRVENL